MAFKFSHISIDSARVRMKLEASSNCSEFTIVFSFSATLSKSQPSYQLTASSSCWSTTIFADCKKLKVVKPAADHDGYTLLDIVKLEKIPDKTKSKELLNWLIDVCRLQALDEQNQFTNVKNKTPVNGQLYYCCDYVPLSTIGKLLKQPLAASQQHKADVALIMNGLPVIQFNPFYFSLCLFFFLNTFFLRHISIQVHVHTYTVGVAIMSNQ